MSTSLNRAALPTSAYSETLDDVVMVMAKAHRASVEEDISPLDEDEDDEAPAEGEAVRQQPHHP